MAHAWSFGACTAYSDVVSCSEETSWCGPEARRRPPLHAGIMSEFGRFTLGVHGMGDRDSGRSRAIQALPCHRDLIPGVEALAAIANSNQVSTCSIPINRAAQVASMFRTFEVPPDGLLGFARSWRGYWQVLRKTRHPYVLVMTMSSLPSRFRSPNRIAPVSQP